MRDTSSVGWRMPLGCLLLPSQQQETEGAWGGPLEIPVVWVSALDQFEAITDLFKAKELSSETDVEENKNKFPKGKTQTAWAQSQLYS